MTTHIIPLSWGTPPLTANQRKHWREKAALTRAVRTEVATRARAQKLPTGLERVTVRLHYVPAQNRRRDPSNLMPTQKAAVDGLVDHGLVPDDCPPYVTEEMPRVHPADRSVALRMWLEVAA
ncbi:MAG: hypothetical protein Q4F65_12540 [Propionibacteriaceae bacterium]|nr:hypothetical protein [Propionibacteriaceae bacterium]